MDDATPAGQLFLSLLGDPTVTELQALRKRLDLEIRSVAVNGDRVDIVAATSVDEWRVVYGSANMTTVDWLRVFARPPLFDGVADGRAVIVNGASSSGKSTLLRTLSARSTAPWVIFDEPMMGEVDPAFLIWRDRAPGLQRGFLDGIAALARAGNLVALAAGGHPPDLVSTAFAGVPTICVGLDCTPDELHRRERRRRDVPGGLWAASPSIHDGWHYDLRFDTNLVAPELIAAEVLRRID